MPLLNSNIIYFWLSYYIVQVIECILFLHTLYYSQCLRANVIISTHSALKMLYIIVLSIRAWSVFSSLKIKLICIPAHWNIKDIPGNIQYVNPIEIPGRRKNRGQAVDTVLPPSWSLASVFARTLLNFSTHSRTAWRTYRSVRYSPHHATATSSPARSCHGSARST